MRFLVLCDGPHMVPILQVMGLKKPGQDSGEDDGSIATACLSCKRKLFPFIIKIGGDNLYIKYYSSSRDKQRADNLIDFNEPC